jgi:hypothetical protein
MTLFQHSDTTTWVNVAEGCIGRFDIRSGVDVHKKPTPELRHDTECLDCTHGPTEDWERFKSSMLQFHGVKVPDRYMPRQLKKRRQEKALTADQGAAITSR